MSKAEEFAIKKYPVSIEDIHGHKVDVNLWQRKACVDGYSRAEKDLELTWEDIKAIDELILYVDRKYSLEGDEFYKEVLKRFKERKEK